MSEVTRSDMTPQNFPLWTLANDEEEKDVFIALIVGWVQTDPVKNEANWGVWIPVVAHPRQGFAYMTNTIVHGGVYLSRKEAEKDLERRIEEIVMHNRGEGRPW